MPIEILMPILSPTMSKTGGKIVKWCKRENDKIKVGDIIAEIETDKAIMELESVDEGILIKILVPEGTSGVAVNQPIALLESYSKDNVLFKSSTALTEDHKTEIEKINNSSLKKHNELIKSSSSILNHISLKNENDKKKKKDNIKKIDDSSRLKISPLAKKIAKDKNLDLKKLKGTGPYGRIIKDDVLKFLNINNNIGIENYNKKLIEKDIILEISSMRNSIAQRMIESKKNIPHFYLTIDSRIDKLILLKNEINLADKNNKVTINDFIIKAVAYSIRKFPDINSSWSENKIIKHTNIDISIVVALENGLITPIIKNADKKNILSISREIKNLIIRARSLKLKPKEFQGGTFTISNLGMFGIKTFSAIINPPQSCIMAIGAAEKKPIIINEKIEVVEILTITLSADHRIIDGALGAKFLNSFKFYMENPLIILLEV